MFGALLGAGLSAGLSYAGASSANDMTERAQRRAIKAARYNYQHRFQWSMEDMRKAGLNPILAARSGLGGGASAPVTGAGGFKNALEGAATSAAGLGRMAALQQVQQAKANVANTGAQTGVHNANTALAMERVNTQRAQTEAIARENAAGMPEARAEAMRTQGLASGARAQIDQVTVKWLEEAPYLKLIQYAKGLGMGALALGTMRAALGGGRKVFGKWLRSSKAGQEFVRKMRSTAMGQSGLDRGVEKWIRPRAVPKGVRPTPIEGPIDPSSIPY